VPEDTVLGVVAPSICRQALRKPPALAGPAGEAQSDTCHATPRHLMPV